MVAKMITQVSFQFFIIPYFFLFNKLSSIKDKSPNILAFVTRLKKIWLCIIHYIYLRRNWLAKFGSCLNSHSIIFNIPIFAQ